MKTPKSYSKKRTLKTRIRNYISKKQDICCESDIDRTIVIQQIIDKYKRITAFFGEPESEYLGYINNDLVVLIGYKIDLEKAHDHEGLQVWRRLNKRMYVDGKLNEAKTNELLKELPLYFLMSFLGYASYKIDQLDHLNSEMNGKVGLI
jgi:hypothetical protein